MPAPTFVAAYVPAGMPTNTAAAVTVSVTVAAGDTLVISGATALSTVILSTPTGGGLTYTLQEQSVVNSSYDNQYLWTATAGSAQTFNLSITPSGASGYWSFTVLRFSSVASFGAKTVNNGSGAPSLSLTTTSSASAIVFASSDFTGTSGASRTYNTSSAGAFTEEEYDYLSTYITDYVGFYGNPGAAGAKTVGLTAPTGQAWSATAIELVGQSGTSYTQTPADSEPLTDAPTTVLAGQRTQADTQGLTDAATIGKFGSGADTAGLTDAATAVRENRSADAEALTDAVTVSQGHMVTVADTAALSDDGGAGTDVNADPNIGRLPDNTIIAILTRPDITNYQFLMEAIPWCPFGEGQAINVSKFDQGTAATRTQDVPGGRQDVMVFGTDRRTPAVWTFDMFTDSGTIDVNVNEAWVDALAQVWDSDVRQTPNGVIALRYCIGGRLRRVYGRPRRWTPIADAINHGKIKITADFQLSEDMVFYDDDDQSVTVAISVTTLTGTGFKFPITFPLVMATIANPQVGQIVLGGTQKSWLMPTFYGPVTNPWVQIGSQRWSLNGSIAAGDSVSLSGRPWDAGVFAADGTALPGWLDPRSRLSQLRQPPGTYAVTFGGLDLTNTSKCVVRWRNAYRSL